MAVDFGATLVSVGPTSVGSNLMLWLKTCVSARAVPQRGVKSIYYHVKRARDDLGKAGKWEVAEDEYLRR